MFRIISGVMTALFLLSCAVQYNDPDPIRWIVFYGVAAALSVMAIFRRYTVVSIPIALAFVGGFFWQMPGFGVDSWMLLSEPKMSSHDVELAREAVGLLICGVWTAVLAVQCYRYRGIRSESETTQKQTPSA